jgi:predicted RNase H-related nuclease YkuK (DUF458 family)
MEIFMTSFTGKTIVLEVKPYDTIGSVKQKIQEKENMPVDLQRVVYDGKELLEDSKTLAHYNIQKDTTIYMDSVWTCNFVD